MVLFGLKHDFRLSLLCQFTLLSLNCLIKLSLVTVYIIVLIVKYVFSLVPLCKYIILCTLSSFDANPWLYLLPYVPTALLGSGLLLATNCYVSDTTHPEKRAWRLACLQTCVHVGLVIGTLIGPFIYKQLGYTYLFIIAAFSSLSSLLYVVFVVPESVKNESNVSYKTNRLICIKKIPN